MINESLGYVQESDDWVKTVLIGGLLTLLAALVVPALLVFGYLMRVLRGTMRGDERPPEFDEWGDMLVDGFKAFVVTAVYGLVPLVVGGVLVAIGAAGAVSGDSGAAGAAVAVVGGVVTLILGLLAAYVAPAALANYAEKGTVGAAFEFGELRATVTSGTYFTAWIVAFALLVAVSVVSGVLNVVPMLGVLVGAFLSFYAAVSAYYLIGSAWGELHPVQMQGDERADERVTA